MSNTIRITMKAPNSIDHAFFVAKEEGKSPELLDEARSRWFEYGEYCTIEIDLTTMTAKVLPA